MRYVTNAVIVLLGGLMVVLSRTLSSTAAVRWSTFGIALGIVAVSLLVQLDSRRGLVQRLIDAGMVAVGGTLVGATVFFTGTTLAWLVFALALGVVAIGYSGLSMHEIETWREAHDLGDLHGLHPLSVLRHAERPGERAA